MTDHRSTLEDPMPRTDLDILREWLALPVEALPSIVALDDDDAEPPTLWAAARARAAGRRHPAAGTHVRLGADRDGWRDGLAVLL